MERAKREFDYFVIPSFSARRLSLAQALAQNKFSVIELPRTPTDDARELFLSGTHACILHEGNDGPHSRLLQAWDLQSNACTSLEITSGTVPPALHRASFACMADSTTVHVYNLKGGFGLYKEYTLPATDDGGSQAQAKAISLSDGFVAVMRYHDSEPATVSLTAWSRETGEVAAQVDYSCEALPDERCFAVHR